MGDRAAVTVVIPLFDTGRYVGAAVESALAQAVPVEVVVVDDGSTDDGPAVVAGFGPPVRLLRHDHTRGPAAARNTAIGASDAPFVSFLDADDLMAPDRLSTHLRYFDEHPGAGFVLGHQELLLEDGRAVPPWLHHAVPFGMGPALIDVQPLGGTVRRRTFATVGLFDEALHVSEDIDWLLRCREAGAEVLVVPEVSVHRRIHETNMSHAGAATGEMQAAVLQAVHRILRRRRAAAGERGGDTP